MEERRLAGGRPIRLGPWRGRRDVASLATYADHRLALVDVEECLELLRSRGYRRVITAALMPAEAAAFVEAGFDPLHRLVLLRRDLRQGVPRTPVRLRRWRRRSYDRILEIDASAFEDFWRFDLTALKDALAATPHRALRVPRAEPILAYALSGVSGARGYLQRLAVHPDSQGLGLGTGLLLDGLHWMQSRGALEAFVNTQPENTRALELYGRHGFEIEPDQLAIFDRVL